MQDIGDLRVFVIIAWVQLLTVMYGGHALLGLLTRDETMTLFRRANFRAGHAHAGVLTILSLLYYLFLSQTSLSIAVKVCAASAFLVGILLQSGGFFVHMVRGEHGRRSLGTTITVVGAVVLSAAALVLIYGLIFEWQ